MRIGSLFSGGGGGDLGFVRAGHRIVFGCEIVGYGPKWPVQRLNDTVGGVNHD